MNCLDFRRKSLTDPVHLDNEMKEHRDSCDTCLHYLEEIVDLDQSIEQVFNIDVSDDLGARILLTQTLASREKKKWLRPFAVAASILLMLSGIFFSVSESSVGELALQHVLDEPEVLAHREMQSQKSIVDALAKLNYQLQDSLGDVVHTGICDINGQLAVHMIVEVENELVTAIVMPNESIDAVTMVARGSWVGKVMPFYQGSLAIIQASASPAMGVVEDLLKASLYYDDGLERGGDRRLSKYWNRQTDYQNQIHYL